MRRVLRVLRRFEKGEEDRKLESWCRSLGSYIYIWIGPCTAARAAMAAGNSQLQVGAAKAQRATLHLN